MPVSAADDPEVGVENSVPEVGNNGKSWKICSASRLASSRVDADNMIVGIVREWVSGGEWSTGKNFLRLLRSFGSSERDMSDCQMPFVQELRTVPSLSKGDPGKIYGGIS